MRTPREFSNAGITVRVLCRCGHEKAIDPLDFAFTHGDDFDLAGSTVALSAELRCEACGNRPVVSFSEADSDFVAERPSRRMRMAS